MEAVVILGIIGTGYLLNNKVDHSIDHEINPNIQIPSHNSVYDTNNYLISKQMQEISATDLINNKDGKTYDINNKTQKITGQLFDEDIGFFNINHSKDKIFDSKGNDLTNDQYIGGSERWDKIKQSCNIDTDTGNIECHDIITEDSHGHGYQAVTTPSQFLQNDQGFLPQPETNNNTNIDDNRIAIHQGGYNALIKQNKKEKGPLFDPFKNQENIYSRSLIEHDHKDRYILSDKKEDMRLPNTQKYIQPIDIKDSINGDLARIIANKKSIDNKRSILNRQKTYTNRLIPGKALNSTREVIPNVSKNRIETFYENSPDKYLVTTGDVIESSSIPETIMPITNRQYLNKQPIGNVGVHVDANSTETIHNNDINNVNITRQQLKSDTMLNVTGATSSTLDQDSLGYTMKPNERDVTTERNHQSNVLGNVSHTTHLQDELKNTIKQTTINHDKVGIATNEVNASIVGVQDNIQRTLKETMLNNDNNGNLTGLLKPEIGLQDDMKPTIKEGTQYSHTSNGLHYVHGDIDRTSNNTYETNPTKECISKGRSPTTESTKLTNGIDHVNMDIKKIDNDYMNSTIRNPNKIYNVRTNNKTECEITTNKMKYNDAELLLNQIDPKLLDPFNTNPYTHKLTNAVF